jgi:hypothetical protein
MSSASSQQPQSASDKYTFVIPLVPQNKPIPLHSFKDYPAFLSHEYATRYLEKLGATASQHNVNILLNSMPIEKCGVSAIWRKDGSLQDAVVIRAYGGGQHSATGTGLKKARGHTVHTKSELAAEEKARHPDERRGKEGSSPRRESPADAMMEDAPPLAASSSQVKLLSSKGLGGTSRLHYSDNQKRIILRQLLLGLLRPFSTSESEMVAAQELFVKKFPFEELVKELSNSKLASDPHADTNAYPTARLTKELPELGINTPRGGKGGRAGSPVGRGRAGSPGGRAGSPGGRAGSPLGRKSASPPKSPNKSSQVARSRRITTALTSPTNGGGAEDGGEEMTKEDKVIDSLVKYLMRDDVVR